MVSSTSTKRTRRRKVRARPSKKAELRRFLRVLFKANDLIELRPIEIWEEDGEKKNRLLPSQRVWLTRGELVDRFASLQRQTRAERANIFFGVCPRPEMGAGKSTDIEAVRVLWADLDKCTPKEALHRVGEAGLPKPTVVIVSGHGTHLYWKLVRPVVICTRKDRARVEGGMQRISDAIRGDHTQDLARILRLPGFDNVKNARNEAEPVPCRIHRMSDRTTTLRAVERLLPKGRSRKGIGSTRTNRGAGQDQVESWAVRALRKKPADGDRSRRDFGVFCWLIEFGLEKERAWEIARDYSKFADRERKYFEATWKKAAKHVGKAERLPMILVSRRPTEDISQQAVDALTTSNDPPRLFVRSGELVRIDTDQGDGRPIVRPATDRVIAHELARAARCYLWRKAGPDHVNPPQAIIHDILAARSWPFPLLAGLVEGPMLRPNGTILDEPSYDEETHTLYVPAPDLELPSIPRKPSDRKVKESLRWIGDAMGEFPFDSDASRANAWAGLLTPIIRRFVGGPVPLEIIDAPSAGSGKTLLANLTAIIASGREAVMMAVPRDEDEMRKRITSLLFEGAAIVNIDNVDRPLGHAHLAAVLTTEEWSDRILGKTEEVRLPQRATWMATGNNIKVGGDMARRCYWVRLDPKVSKPWERTEFRHPDLLGWARRNRGQLLAALLTLVRAWIVAGRPDASEGVPLGSFESWTRTVGGTLAFADVSGFLRNQQDMYEQIDEDTSQWLGFLTAWYGRFSSEAVTVKQVLQEARLGTDLRKALPDELADTVVMPNGSLARRLGIALRKLEGKRFGDEGYRFERAGIDGHTKRPKWRVVCD
jgi:hypothetical protein